MAPTWFTVARRRNVAISGGAYDRSRSERQNASPPLNPGRGRSTIHPGPHASGRRSPERGDIHRQVVTNHLTGANQNRAGRIGWHGDGRPRGDTEREGHGRHWQSRAPRKSAHTIVPKRGAKAPHGTRLVRCVARQRPRMRLPEAQYRSARASVGTASQYSRESVGILCGLRAPRAKVPIPLARPHAPPHHGDMKRLTPLTAAPAYAAGTWFDLRKPRF